ncbi:MAG TPA: hypothetical protein VFP89_08850 [Propionibacteriaceae bacterium]|nr:hypothetical protein [Propionibacteriaceae bacterium]
MIELRFSGWFQCRLATDPDPYDEPRGVSGYVHAYVGEPDLDRIIFFQPPAFARSFAPRIGVVVDKVLRDGQPVADHPLLGAAVDLLSSPKFEGRNGVIADDGLEPIFPFVLEITKDDFRLVRSVQPENPDYPYPELFAAGVEGAPDEIREATGINNLATLWQRRRAALQAALDAADETEEAGLLERLAFLDQQLRLGGGAARFFFARMRYDYSLATPVIVEDPQGWLPEAAVSDPPAWPAQFWFGAWDADVLCGFARGTLTIDAEPSASSASGRPARVTDRRP